MHSFDSIAKLVRRVTFTAFLGALVIGSISFYFLFRAASMSHVEDEARNLLDTAIAVRTYTARQIRPQVGVDADGTFVRESVPSYAAQTVFEMIASTEGYLYREAATNSTNPDDLANAFEQTLLSQFRADATLEETSGLVRIGGEQVFYLARPIRIENEACLECHSTPDIAPASMVRMFGPTGGFGWQLGDVAAIQLLIVPITGEMRSIYEIVTIFVAMLLVLFAVVVVTVTLPLRRHVTQPLASLAAAADRASRRDIDAPLPTKGSEEITRLAEAIERLRTSLALALKGDGTR